MFAYTFQAMWRHRPLKEYSIFVGIHVASTFFILYTLGLPSREILLLEAVDELLKEPDLLL